MPTADCYTDPVSRLVINADDFGLTPGINRAIAETHQQGIVTSATLMANGPALEDAVRVARLLPTLGVGCHVVLVDGAPVLDPRSLPSLIADGTREFRASWASFASAAARARLRPGEIEAEAIAQIRKLQVAGINVSHVDTHKHTHMFPQVLAPLLRAARACGVSRIRNPFDPAGVAFLVRWPALWKRWFTTRMLARYAADFRHMVEAEGMFTPEGCLGLVATGALDDGLLNWILGHVPQGIWELVCHPGYVDEPLRSVRTRLRESRAMELRLLTSAAMRESLARAQIELVPYQAVGSPA
jgi:chitin disaccharide deacetylase